MSMTKENYQILMAYCSPYGNTRWVADAMRKTIDSLEIRVSMVELTKSSDLDYQEDTIRQQMLQRSFEAAKSHFPPKNINQERCTMCGIIGENCLVSSIEIVDAPMIN